METISPASAARVKMLLDRALTLWGHGGNIDHNQRQQARHALQEAVDTGALHTKHRELTRNMSRVLR